MCGGSAMKKHESQEFTEDSYNNMDILHDGLYVHGLWNETGG